MRTYKSKSQLLIISLAVGFFIGIIYENVASIGNVIPTDMFLKSNLQRFLQTDIITEKYIFYVVKERLLVMAVILLLSCIKWKKVFVILLLATIGFFIGVLSVAAVLQLGIKGILLCIAGVFPQGLFYGIGYSLLFVYWFRFPERQWNRVKMIFVILMFLVGILLEVYVNPILVKWVIKIL